jgi:hypothetical protein
LTAALTDVCPEDFLRAGAVFGQVAEQLTGTIVQAHRSAEVDWIGPPGQAYRRDLDGLVADLRRIQRAYDHACDALVSYSRSLVQVRDLAVRAGSLAAQALSLEQQRMIDATYLPIVIHPMTAEQERLQQQARILSEAADRAEYTASTRLAAQLHDLAADAPHLSGWQSANRSLGRFGAGVGQPLAGGLSMAGDAYLSTPFVGDAASRDAAREALKEEALAMAQPWLGIEALLKELGDGQFAHVSGSLAAGLIMRKWGAIDSKNVRLFGTHDGLPEPVLLAMRRGIDPDLRAVNGWVLEHEQRTFGELLERMQALPLPGVEDLIKNGADLLLQEARGGHMLLKHVGRDAEFLNRRMLLEPVRDGLVPKSSFVDLDEAERIVASALATGGNELRAWAATDERRLRMREPLSEPAGLLVNVHGQVVQAQRVVMEFVRERDGSVRLATAYVEE